MDDARGKGLKTYYTGIMCVNGHYADRYLTSRNCVACRSNDKYRKELKLKIRGVTEEEYDGLIYQQNNKCAICENKLGKGQDITIDHCHNTNIVRGILCRNCNMGLGQFRDSIRTIKNAVKYLEKFKNILIENELI